MYRGYVLHGNHTSADVGAKAVKLELYNRSEHILFAVY